MPDTAEIDVTAGQRLPPQSIEAEQSVLGAALLDRDAIARVAAILKPSDFYRDVHRRLFDVILQLQERNEPVDLVTLTEALKSRGEQGRSQHGLLRLNALGWLTRKSLSLNGKVVPAPPLILWRTPEWMVWLFLLPVIVVLFAVNDWMVEPWEGLVRGCANMAVFISYVYLFQGIQVMRWRLTKTKSPWMVWVVIIVVFAVLQEAAIFSLGVSLAMIGILDLWLDFRRLLPPPEPKDDSQGGMA